MQVNYISESLFEKAQATYINKKYPETIELLKKALDALENHKTPLKGKIYFLMAKTYYSMVLYRESKKFCQKALDCLLIYNKIYEAAQVYDLLGHVCCQVEQYTEAIKNYQNALYILQNFGISNTVKEFIAHLNLSLALAAQSILAYEIQYKHFCRSLFISRQIKNFHLLAKSLLGLGTYFFQRQKFDNGRKILLKAFRFFNGLGDTEGIALSLYTLGQIYYKSMESNRAINALKLAYYLFEHLKNQIFKADTLIQLARIYLQIDIEKSRELCSQATDILSQHTSIHKKRLSEIILGQSYIVMGLYYKQLNHFELARYYIKESMEIFHHYQCENEYQEALYLYNSIATTEPKRKPVKNNILAFKLGMP